MNFFEIMKSYEYKKFKDKFFDGIIGLDYAIKELFAIYAMIQVNEIKKQKNLFFKKHALNMIFYGNPGTGKTTIARKVGAMFYDLKYLSKGHLVEIDRSDLVGEYIGQTSIKTKKILEDAKGGILFIDEAYSLYNEEYTDFGSEAIDIILKFVEDHHEDIIVILAGYKEKIEVMLHNNKGLNSRFPIKIFFEDYNINELKQIFSNTIKINGYEYTNELQKSFNAYLADMVNINSKSLKYNGRFIRNIVESIIRKHDMRIFVEKKYDENLMILNKEDFL